MSSEHDRYKVLVAGDSILGYGLCAKLTNDSLRYPRKLAEKALASDWPEAEWTKFMSVSIDGEITTMELDLELHGPWVWELYNVMEPRDYYRRFDAALLAVNPRNLDSFTHIPEFIDAIHAHSGRMIPIVLVGDSSLEMTEEEVKKIVELGEQLDLPVRLANIVTGENIDQVFRELAVDIQVDKEAGMIDS
ncbi:hypothetical protein EU537_05175 [Candidatus Thorarchaeota archaeon]|nr:MAG: hypothetical protein EU537_05175 [Candidatus Thorarchaeota archaeon]